MLTALEFSLKYRRKHQFSDPDQALDYDKSSWCFYPIYTGHE